MRKIPDNLTKIDLQLLRSPSAFLRSLVGSTEIDPVLQEYEAWWKAEGQGISDAVDRAGTPWVTMFDKGGKRVDEVLYAPEYWHMLHRGYRAGVLWRAFCSTLSR
jgi:acyl-CoA dehydrogenase